MLDRLSQEILLLVLSYLTQQEDLARLCRVSKPLCSSARPRLYEAIIIKPKDGGDWVNSMNVEPYLRTCSGSQNCLHFVKSIRVVAPFHKVLREICPNRIETDLSDDHDSDHGQNATGDAILADGEDERRKVDDVSHTARVHSNQLTSNSLPVHPNVDKPSTDLCPLTTKLMPLLLQLQDDSLRSFHWHLGTSVPEALLGPSGYLTQRQSRIENLSFITCWRCKGQYQVTYQRHKPNPVYTFELGAFRTLQSLSWKCLDSVKEFRALKAALCVNAERLKKLEIGLYNGPYAYFILSWLRYNDGEKSSCPNFFVREILAVTKPNAEPFFPSLTALSLSDFSFRGGTKELAIAFNVSKLRSLKLDKCPYMGQFLRPVITTYTSPELRIFELTESFCTYEGDEVDGGDGEEVERDIDGSELCPIVGHFLQASTKLEDLFLNVRYVTSATKEYWRFILQHKSSLKRLIYHEREYLTSFEWEGQQKWRDVPFDTSSLSSKRDSEGQLALSCLGISVNFEVVRDSLRSVGCKETLQLLHIRATFSSGTEEERKAFARLLRKVKRFASWIFGRNGYPNLRILAFGDFSYYGQLHHLSKLYCRSFTLGELHYFGEMIEASPGMSKEDSKMWEFLEGNRDFLEACTA